MIHVLKIKYCASKQTVNSGVLGSGGFAEVGLKLRLDRRRRENRDGLSGIRGAYP